MSSAPSVRRPCFSSQVPAASTTSVPPISSRSTSGANSARTRAEPIDAETPASPSRWKRRSSASSAPYARTSAALDRREEPGAKPQQESFGNGGREIPADESHGSSRDGEAEVREREWSERAKIPRHQDAVDEGLEQPDRGGLDCRHEEAGREHNRG